MEVIVVGSGIAGLATAVRLAVAGHEVKVFEANSYPGGKLSEVNINGFRFDAGPSLFTMPNLVTELFELAGKDPKQNFDYIKLEKLCNYFYEDGTRFTAYADKDRFDEELFEQLNIKDTKPVFKYLDKAAQKYKIAYPIFVEKSLHKASTYLSFKTLISALQLSKLELNKSLNQIHEKAFSGHPKLVQYFNRFATYNGSSPFRAPGVFSMIPHLEHNLGAYFPKKGMHHITQSIYTLAKELGVQFYFNSPVSRILVEGKEGKKKIKGIACGTEQHLADIVVSNADIHATYKKLLPRENHPTDILNKEKSSSALIFYWGMNKSFPELDLHNIFFSTDAKTEFKHIFSYHTVYYDPTVYVNITSKYKPDDAPAGCENWFVMINVPYNSQQMWDVAAADTKRNIITKLNRILKTNIEPHIVAEQILDPLLIESKTSSESGSLYGTASNSKLAAFYRHKNFSSDINGLYFCGGSVHPGGGIPLCLNSAKIVAGLIKPNK